MENIKVTICTGNTCKPLGNMELFSKLQTYVDRNKLNVAIELQNCFVRCQIKEEMLCPCVKVDEEWIKQADWQKLKKLLTEKED